MLNLHLLDKEDKKLSILCLGAHGDDIEIGCGGTILRLLDEYSNINIHWVVFSGSATSQRQLEVQDSAKAFIHNAKNKIVVKDFRDGFMPFIGAEVKDYFEQLKQQIQPNLIFTHHRDDLHQDHRLISNLTWNTFRNHLILEYEIFKYDGGLGSPNFFVPLSETTCNRKIEHLFEYFASQTSKHWFTKDAFFSLLRIRGLECNSPTKYAEAFYNYKLVI